MAKVVSTWQGSTTTCDHCRAGIAFGAEDVYYDTPGRYYIACPNCNKRTELFAFLLPSKVKEKAKRTWIGS